MKNQIKKSEIEIEFSGYDHYKAPGHFFMYPMELTHCWWALSGSEQKVLDCIIRKTYGWQKQGDNIAISQIMNGDDGRSGTGLSRSQVKLALKSLEKKKFIAVTRRHRKPSYIELPLAKAAVNLDGCGDVEVRVHRKRLNAEFKKELVEENENNWVSN